MCDVYGGRDRREPPISLLMGGSLLVASGAAGQAGRVETSVTQAVTQTVGQSGEDAKLLGIQAVGHHFMNVTIKVFSNALLKVVTIFGQPNAQAAKILRILPAVYKALGFKPFEHAGQARLGEQNIFVELVQPNAPVICPGEVEQDVVLTHGEIRELFTALEAAHHRDLRTVQRFPRCCGGLYRVVNGFSDGHAANSRRCDSESSAEVVRCYVVILLI